MFVTSLILGLVGVFCILDSRILGRLNFERPLITCTIVGSAAGQPAGGSDCRRIHRADESGHRQHRRGRTSRYEYGRHHLLRLCNPD